MNAFISFLKKKLTVSVLRSGLKTNGVNYYGLRNFLTNGFLERNHYTTNALDLNETLFQNFAKLFIR